MQNISKINHVKELKFDQNIILRRFLNDYLNLLSEKILIQRICNKGTVAQDFDCTEN